MPASRSENRSLSALFLAALIGVVLALFAFSTPAAADEGALSIALASSEDAVSAIPIRAANLNRFAAAYGYTENAYDYTGSIQEFESLYPDGYTFTLEVWGGSGGNYWGSYYGGNGGYSKGNVTLNKNDKLYIAVGGQGAPQRNGSEGTRAPGGWNGGGHGGLGVINQYMLLEDGSIGWDYPASPGGGGGATHIAKTKRGDGQLANYSSNRGDIYIVAGGGGGSQPVDRDSSGYYINDPGRGGGTTGTGGTNHRNANSNPAATQTSGYQFGKGQNGRDGTNAGEGAEGGGGAGGGWYGGYSSQATGDFTQTCGGGGSGYIGGVSSGTTTTGANFNSNGKAVITYRTGYIVRYHGNTNTSGSLTDSFFNIGIAGTLKANGFVKTGYNPVGWATSTDHATRGIVDWALGATSNDFGATYSLQVIDLYMVWTPKKATVTFMQNANETDQTKAIVTYTYDATNQGLHVPAGFAKTGYTQTGWSWTRKQNSNTSTESTAYEYGVDTSGRQSPAFSFAEMNQWIIDHEGSCTLFATWKPNQYRVRIYHNLGADWGGASYYDRTMVYDHSKNNDLTREATAEAEMNPGKTFDGYWTAANGGTKVYTQYGLAVNDSNYWLNGFWHKPAGIELWAHWR